MVDTEPAGRAGGGGDLSNDVKEVAGIFQHGRVNVVIKNNLFMTHFESRCLRGEGFGEGFGQLTMANSYGPQSGGSFQ